MAITFYPNREIALKFFHEFPEDVFIGVSMESLLGDEEVWPARLQ
jgi:hypothetical protein